MRPSLDDNLLSDYLRWNIPNYQTSSNNHYRIKYLSDDKGVRRLHMAR